MNNADRKIAEQVKQNGTIPQQQGNTAPKNNNQNTFDKTQSAIGGVGASLGQMSNQVSDEVSDGLADRTCADIVIKTGQKISGMLSGDLPPGQLTQQAMQIFLGGFTGVSQQLITLEPTNEVAALEPSASEEEDTEEIPLSASTSGNRSLTPSLPKSNSVNGNSNGRS